MTTTQIPPDGTAAEFIFEVPAPGDLTTLGGIRLYFTFGLERPTPGNFSPNLYVDGDKLNLSDRAMGPLSITNISQFQEPLDAPAQAKVTVNEAGTLSPGNTVTIYAWGAQTESGSGALNPDEGGEPSVMTDTIEVGTVEVLTWQQWNQLTGGSQAISGS
ncbi:hypothetical protein [Streptomyces cucumeris]|uniref:hypothetical protein n=1 Tax=Streptomyces cucumeris TaxID=2962890 RepID=UPI0020C928F8|nr:hypothetical protein [Streptomyces sp. NEAU-Y11]MCP9209711.1 hypothetical protein [Streptomyces sp. NEAU-Y11]